jgi:hypothetical protein
MRRLAGFVIIIASASACTTDMTSQDRQSTSQTDGEPAPMYSAALATAGGTWSIDNRFQVGVDVLLPQTAADALDVLRGLSENPAHTLFDLAEQAGVPAVGEVRAALPGVLEDRLEGWVNDAIAEITIDGVPATEILGGYVAQVDALRSEMIVTSELELGDPDFAGETVCRHTARTVAFPAVSGEPLVIPAQLGEIGVGADDVAVTIAYDGAVELGAHFFGIPVGDWAIAGLDALAGRVMGVADLRAALGVVVDCPAIAQDVASQCLFGQCVGHEAQLVEICEAGLDMLTAELHEKLHEYDVSAIRFVAGSAKLVDADDDGVVETIADGVWDATVNAGQGERATPATFTGARL